MTVPAGESPAPPSSVSHMGTMVQTHPATSCSHLVVPQVQVLQWQHGQGSLHLIGWVLQGPNLCC